MCYSSTRLAQLWSRGNPPILLILRLKLGDSSKLRVHTRASLVVEWLRICLAMQGTLV